MWMSDYLRAISVPMLTVVLHLCYPVLTALGGTSTPFQHLCRACRPPSRPIRQCNYVNAPYSDIQHQIPCGYLSISVTLAYQCLPWSPSVLPCVDGARWRPHTIHYGTLRSTPHPKPLVMHLMLLGVQFVACSAAFNSMEVLLAHIHFQLLASSMEVLRAHIQVHGGLAAHIQFHGSLHPRHHRAGPRETSHTQPSGVSVCSHSSSLSLSMPPGRDSKQAQQHMLYDKSRKSVT
jgi:hypothetical protein